jgi:transcriptional regulator with XRE-family HTH domain
MTRLQALREERRWSRAELARRAGMHPATVGAIESGRLRPYPGQLAKLAAALGHPEGADLLDATRHDASEAQR